jgi:pimeloyl-ACP methyl ester carboxylesterase
MTDPVRGRVVRYPASGGIRLEAEAWGSDDGSPVLLAHGGGQTRLSWQETASRLAEAGFFAVAVDLRGHGGSDRAADYSLTAFRDDIAALAQRLGRPALVGASLGGQSSLLAEGETYGGVARALVLVDVAPTLEPEGVRRIMAFMERHLDGFASIDEAIEAVIAYQPHRPARPEAVGLRRSLREGADGRLYWHWDPAFLDQARLHLDLVWERATAAARFVTVPTLLVRGERSDVLGPAGVEELCRLIPQAQVEDIAEAHHMVAGDENDAFTAAVLSFLQGLDALRGVSSS